MATPEKYIAPCSTLISEKQLEILSIVARGNPDGSYVDTFQVLERASYTDSLEAIRFILRYMIAQGRIERADYAERSREWGRGGRGVHSRKTPVFKITDNGLFLLKSGD